jgi:NTE family protein
MNTISKCLAVFVVGLSLGLLLVTVEVAKASTYIARSISAVKEKCQPYSRSQPNSPPELLNIALSGGGYRAMLFHVGALWRLHELGLLDEATQISSVSGGSITAAVLALQWDRIQRDLEVPPDDRGLYGSSCFRQLVAGPLMQMAQVNVDFRAAIFGIFGATGGRRLEVVYAKKLYGDATLSRMPDKPLFRLNATNFQTGAVFSFFKNGVSDPSIGSKTGTGNIRIAKAVAASSAFPPYLSPVRLSLDTESWVTAPETPEGSMLPTPASSITIKQVADIRKNVILVDGGVADNLGLEAIYDNRGRFIISDGGGSAKVLTNPATDWFSQVPRVVALIHDQPSELRVQIFNEGRRQSPPPSERDAVATAANKSDGSNKGMGVYWSMAQKPPQIGGCTSPVDPGEITRLAHIDTRLKRLTEGDIKRLVNWGYHSADYSLPYLESIQARNPKYQTSPTLPFSDANIFGNNASVSCVLE